MRFTKMQGCGNDYIYVNAMEERVESPGRLAKAVSDRHFGIGADGLILIGASKTADFSMEMYNADGSKGAMWQRHPLCGKIRVRAWADEKNDAGHRNRQRKPCDSSADGGESE